MGCAAGTSGRGRRRLVAQTYNIRLGSGALPENDALGSRCRRLWPVRGTAASALSAGSVAPLSVHPGRRGGARKGVVQRAGQSVAPTPAKPVPASSVSHEWYVNNYASGILSVHFRHDRNPHRIHPLFHRPAGSGRPRPGGNCAASSPNFPTDSIGNSATGAPPASIPSATSPSSAPSQDQPSISHSTTAFPLSVRSPTTGIYPVWGPALRSSCRARVGEPTPRIDKSCVSSQP